MHIAIFRIPSVMRYTHHLRGKACETVSHSRLQLSYCHDPIQNYFGSGTAAGRAQMGVATHEESSDVEKTTDADKEPSRQIKSHGPC